MTLDTHLDITCCYDVSYGRRCSSWIRPNNFVLFPRFVVMNTRCLSFNWNHILILNQVCHFFIVSNKNSQNFSMRLNVISFWTIFISIYNNYLTWKMLMTINKNFSEMECLKNKMNTWTRFLDNVLSKKIFIFRNIQKIKRQRLRNMKRNETKMKTATRWMGIKSLQCFFRNGIDSVNPFRKLFTSFTHDRNIPMTQDHPLPLLQSRKASMDAALVQ